MAAAVNFGPKACLVDHVVVAVEYVEHLVPENEEDLLPVVDLLIVELDGRLRVLRVGAARAG